MDSVNIKKLIKANIPFFWVHVHLYKVESNLIFGHSLYTMTCCVYADRELFLRIFLCLHLFLLHQGASSCLLKSISIEKAMLC